MRHITLIFLLLILTNTFAQSTYVPSRSGKWQTKTAQDLGINAMQLEKAVSFAKANEYSQPKDIRLAIYKAFEHEPFHELKGPTRERGNPSGMIIKDGYLVASWGDTKRVDMTFSVTKSYLSTMAGLAVDNQLIANVDDAMSNYIWDGNFDGRHNSKITWRHLLTQSSDWSGTLWDSNDWADRPPKNGDIDDWKNRTYAEPGTVFEYNDVRVNLLAYSLLNVWRKPLPVVLKEKIMDPIGASTTWRWFGYDDSFTLIDGLKMQSVSGGGHSGGGLFISTEDHARFGLLFLREGNWNGQQLISKDWIKKATQPSIAEREYGFMWWLNPDGDGRLSNLSKNAYYAAGFGGNYIIVEPNHDLVIVARWLEPSKANEFVALIKAALK